MVRTSLGAGALLSLLVVAWGCGNGVSDTAFGGHDATGGNATTGGNAATGGSGQGGSPSSVGGSGQGGTHGPGGGTPSAGGSTPGTGGAGQGGAGNGGPGGSGPGSGGGATCQSFDACTDCLANDCSATYCACSSEAACVDITLCFQQCQPSNASCYQACETHYPDGISSFYLVENCSAGSCKNDCPGATALTPCQECLFTSCDTQMNACLANADCNALLTCVGQCAPSDMICPITCASQHPSGGSLASAVRQCSQMNCASCP